MEILPERRAFSLSLSLSLLLPLLIFRRHSRSALVVVILFYLYFLEWKPLPLQLLASYLIRLNSNTGKKKEIALLNSIN